MGFLFNTAVAAVAAKAGAMVGAGIGLGLVAAACGCRMLCGSARMGRGHSHRNSTPASHYPTTDTPLAAGAPTPASDL